MIKNNERLIIANQFNQSKKSTEMKKLFLPLAVMLSFVFNGFVANAQTADEIINKYVDAIGGKENWKKINSMKVEGNVEVQGLEIPFTINAVHSKGMRMEGEFQGSKFIDILTPEKGWSQNPFAGKATLQPLTADELKEKADELDIQGAFVDYKDKGSVVEFLGKDEEDGNEYLKVKLTTKNKNETTYFFDPKTNLIYKQESTTKQNGQEVKQSVKLLDYQKTDAGVKVPFKVDQGGMVLATKKITFNVAVDEKLFTEK